MKLRLEEKDGSPFKSISCNLSCDRDMFCNDDRIPAKIRVKTENGIDVYKWDKRKELHCEYFDEEEDYFLLYVFSHRELEI